MAATDRVRGSARTSTAAGTWPGTPRRLAPGSPHQPEQGITDETPIHRQAPARRTGTATPMSATRTDSSRKIDHPPRRTRLEPRRVAGLGARCPEVPARPPRPASTPDTSMDSPGRYAGSASAGGVFSSRGASMRCRGQCTPAARTSPPRSRRPPRAGTSRRLRAARSPADRGRDSHAQGDKGCGVVHEALAAEDRQHPARQPQLAPHRGGGHRVGRRHDRTQRERRGQRNPGITASTTNPTTTVVASTNPTERNPIGREIRPEPDVRALQRRRVQQRRKEQHQHEVRIEGGVRYPGYGREPRPTTTSNTGAETRSRRASPATTVAPTNSPNAASPTSRLVFHAIPFRRRLATASHRNEAFPARQNRGNTEGASMYLSAISKKPPTPRQEPTRAARSASPWAPPGFTAHLPRLRACRLLDSSPERHARAHFQVRHPVIRSAEKGEDWRWCFVHELLPGKG